MSLVQMWYELMMSRAVMGAEFVTFIMTSDSLSS